MKFNFIFCLLVSLLVISPDRFVFGVEKSASKDSPQLIKMVVLSRHGVRAPTQTERTLATWSQKPWPKWPVERGDLTERGAGLVTEMWKNMRLQLIKDGLLPENSCPTQNQVYIRADVDERTKATAKAIINGIAKDCHLGFATLEKEKIDPLFHPVKAGLYRFNGLEAATDVLAMTQGNLGIIQDELERTTALLGSILGPLAPNLCTNYTMVPHCVLGDLPNAISISPNGEDIKLLGSLGIGSSVAEIFLLEFAQWPNETAGWGMVSQKVLQQVMPAHTIVFNIVNRSHLVAWAKGSPLLKEMADALTNSHYDPRCNDARLVIFVGHDTNIANIGSLLKINWRPMGFPENGIPPAAALALELWEHDKNFYILARFYNQTPEGLHTPLPSDDSQAALLDFKPAKAIVSNEDSSVEFRFSPDEFMEIVKKATAGSVDIPRVNPPFYYGDVEPARN